MHGKCSQENYIGITLSRAFAVSMRQRALVNRNAILRDPRSDVFLANISCGQIFDGHVRIIIVRNKFHAVLQEKNFQYGRCDALVAVREWMKLCGCECIISSESWNAGECI